MRVQPLPGYAHDSVLILLPYKEFVGFIYQHINLFRPTAHATFGSSPMLACSLFASLTAGLLSPAAPSSPLLLTTVITLRHFISDLTLI